jgi:carboxymethylenebutenolidase
VRAVRRPRRPDGESKRVSSATKRRHGAILRAMKTLQIETPDGVAPACMFGDTGPRVLCFMDGVGMRPAMHRVGARIAAGGYRVLMPDLFYRLGAYTAPDPKELFSDPTARADWWARLTPLATTDNFRKDIGAYLEHLGPGAVGAVGYCMGGRLALLTAGWFGDRIAAAAAYHPGGLVTDKPDSPHLLAASIKARVYIGAASEDANFDVAAQQTLTQALTAAGVEHTLEVYPARHGWVPADTPVHDEAATARHYETMFALFGSTLRA